MKNIAIKVDKERHASAPRGAAVIMDNSDCCAEFEIADGSGFDTSSAISAEFITEGRGKLPSVQFNNGRATLPRLLHADGMTLYIGLTQGDIKTTTAAVVRIDRSVSAMANGRIAPDPDYPTDYDELPAAEEVALADQVVIDNVSEGKRVRATIEQVLEAGGGGTVTVDEELSLESENPAQNKVITQALLSKIGINDPVTNILFDIQDETTATVTGYTFDQLSAAVQKQGRVDVYLAGDAQDRSTWTRIIPVYISSDTMYFTTPTLFVESSVPALIFCRVDKAQQNGSAEITYSVTQLQRLVALDSTPTFGSDVPVESNGIYLALQEKYTKPERGIPGSDLAPGVVPEAGTATPSALGQNGSAGSSSKYAKEDHVHPMPSAEDVGAQSPFLTTTLTIAVSDWNNGSCTKTVTGMTADSLVFVKYSDTETEYTEAQGTNSLTFTADPVPSEAVTVDVAWFKEVSV